MCVCVCVCVCMQVSMNTFENLNKFIAKEMHAIWTFIWNFKIPYLIYWPIIHQRIKCIDKEGYNIENWIFSFLTLIYGLICVEGVSIHMRAIWLLIITNNSYVCFFVSNLSLVYCNTVPWTREEKIFCLTKCSPMVQETRVQSQVE